MADKKLNISLKEGGALGLINIFSSRGNCLNLIKSKITIYVSWRKRRTEGVEYSASKIMRAARF